MNDIWFGFFIFSTTASSALTYLALEKHSNYAAALLVVTVLFALFGAIHSKK